MPANFTPLSKFDEADRATLNETLRQLCESVNVLEGDHGPVTLNNDLDMAGHQIKNVGAASARTDALTQAAADPLYAAKLAAQSATTGAPTGTGSGAASTPSTAQASPLAMTPSTNQNQANSQLQAMRRLNDRTQLETYSTFLNKITSTPPGSNTSTVAGVNNGDGTSTGTISAGNYLFADGTSIPYPQSSITIPNPVATTYYFAYLRYSDNTVQFDGPYLDQFSISQFGSNVDGRGYIGAIAFAAGGGATGGGGGGGPLGCLEVGTPLSIPPGSEVVRHDQPCEEWVEIVLANRRRVVAARNTLISVFKRVQDLHTGDLVEVEGGDFVPLHSIKVLRHKGTKMVLVVIPGHTYYGNTARFHNTKPIGA